MITLISGMLALTGCGSSAPSASSSAPGSDTFTEWPSLPPVVSTEQFCTVKVPAGITQRALQAPDGLSLSSAWLGSADQDNPLRTIRPRHVDDQLHLVAVTAAGATKPDAIVILSSSARKSIPTLRKTPQT